MTRAVRDSVSRVRHRFALTPHYHPQQEEIEVSTQAQKTKQRPSVERSRWRLDTARSEVAFQTGNFWGLTAVKGNFDRYFGILDLAATQPIELTIDADSVDTKNRRRDKH